MPVASSSEQGNEPSGSINGVVFLEHLNDCRFLKNNILNANGECCGLASSEAARPLRVEEYKRYVLLRWLSSGLWHRVVW